MTKTENGLSGDLVSNEDLGVTRKSGLEPGFFRLMPDSAEKTISTAKVRNHVSPLQCYIIGRISICTEKLMAHTFFLKSSGNSGS